jgi:lipopolysaccharide export system permease protein
VNILDRYFLKEFFKPFIVCLVAFLLCMVVYDLFDNINDFIQAKTSFGKILHYYLILVPAWLPVIVMPITLLLSLLYTLSDMSKHGELNAMRASGLDFFRLMSPYFLIGICVSIQMLCVNLAWAPNAWYQAKVVFEKSTYKPQESKQERLGINYYNIAANRFWFVSILNPSQGWARGIEITVNDEHLKKDIKKISAARGNYERGRWILHDVIIYDYTLPIADPHVIRKEDIYIANDFTEAPKDFVVEVQKTKRMTTGELLQSLKFTSHLSPKQYALFATEFHSRIAYPLSNFVVFLIGIPFGVIGQRKSTFLAVVNALGIFFVYFIFIQILFMLGQSGRLSPLLAGWTPHLLFIGIGIWMIRRIR